MTKLKVKDEVLLKLLAELLEKEKKTEADRTDAIAVRKRIGSTLGFQQACQGFNRQKNCRHMKGARKGRSGIQDSSVHCHMFIDGSEKIWCTYCSFEVWNKPEFSFKWRYALTLWERTRESASSSERPVPEFLGPEAGRGEFRFKDLRQGGEKDTLPLGGHEHVIKGRQPSQMDWRPELKDRK